MEREVFYTRLAEILEQRPEEFAAAGRRLPDDPDSLVLLGIMALMDEMGVTLSPAELKQAHSADDLLEIVANEVK
jgi:acyl carrier protein